MFRRSRWFSILLTAAAAGLAVAGCARDETSSSPDAAEARASAEAETPEERDPIPVAVHVLGAGRAEGAVRAWGTIRPRREAQILAELGGRVTSVQVTLGDAVRRDRVLLEIDPDLYVARVEEAESRLASATLAEAKARKDLERKEALFEKRTVSDSEIEAARTAAAEAEALRAAARASLEQARKSLSSARIRAPFDGHVASRPPDVGSSVSIGTPLVTVVDVDRLRVEALLSEKDLARVELGDEVTLSVDAVPGRVFPGRMAAIGPQTDPQTKQFPVEIEVENPAGHPLRGGMVARVGIVYEAHENVPLLPVDALVEAEDGLTFFVVQGGVARRRQLEAGPRQGQRIAVLEGAAPGDTVVVLGQLRLTEGSPVQIEETR
jgi:RND family efflux transporter MFP subunit